MNEIQPKRRGGCGARRRLRDAPKPVAERAIRPGMEGGLYKPLTDAEIKRIHQAALGILEKVGFECAIRSCIELITNAGGFLTDTGRLLFPRGLVEDTISPAGRTFVLHSRNPE